MSCIAAAIRGLRSMPKSILVGGAASALVLCAIGGGVALAALADFTPHYISDDTYHQFRIFGQVDGANQANSWMILDSKRGTKTDATTLYVQPTNAGLTMRTDDATNVAGVAVYSPGGSYDDAIVRMRNFVKNSEVQVAASGDVVVVLGE